MARRSRGGRADLLQACIARACVVALGGGAAGCADTIRTPYDRPAIEVPAGWSATSSSGAPSGDPRGAPSGAPVSAPAPEAAAPWWHAFGDARLDALIEEALRVNADLAAATSRVRQASLRADLAASALRPVPTASLSAAYSKGELGASRSSGANASVAYELDLWGRLASARDAARWEAEAVDEDRRSTAIALAATTANLYWQIAYLNERLANIDESLAYADRTRALVRVQYRAGAVSSLELRQADAAVAGQQAVQRTVRQQRVEARNALELLFDAPPHGTGEARRAAAEPSALPDAMPAAPEAGLPTTLLARRPDLRAAEDRLRRTLAEGDAVRASYYPSLTLTGGVGTASPDLLRVLANPVATLGAGVVLPFLRINDLRLDNALSREQYAEAATLFRQALYRAFADVENALSSRSELLAQGLDLEAQLAAARDVERLYEVRYRAGAASLQVWLDAQERRRAAQLQLSLNRLDRLNAQVTLAKALGG